MRNATSTPLSILALLVLPTFFAVPAVADVEGRIVTSAGLPLEHAAVEDTVRGVKVFTDRDGRFRLADSEPPVLLLVTHPRFEDGAVEVSEPSGPVEVTLVAKQAVYEEIAVTAFRNGDSLAPVSVASTILEPSRDSSPSSLADVVVEVPGVSENGQGGLFQVFSIRGISRNRILTLVDGMRIVTERRAGASVSFLDPNLIGTVDIVRGPASTYYGSGALGGVAQIFPRTAEGLWLASGYESQGDESFLAAGGSLDGWSFGVARREAGDAEAANGTQLFSGFTQTSATLAKSWRRGERTFDLLIVPSAGRDIHKSSTDFPGRPTVYPEENHLLVKVGVASEAGWALSAYAHPNDLETVTTRPGSSRNVVENEALDFGLNWQDDAKLSAKTAARYGIEYFGRRGVEARELETDLSGTGAAPVFLQTLDGQEDEAAFYGSVRFEIGSATLETGGRVTWLRQENAGVGSTDHTAGSGFAGLTAPVGKGFEVAANVGTGLRFPSLTERFFTGTTGRGGVIGNPDLDPERSTNFDLGLRWYGRRLFFAGFVFRNEIDDYIERIEVEPDLLTYVNLLSGTIEGIETEGFFKPRDDWKISWSAHRMEGRDAAGGPLADVPVDELRLGTAYSPGPWDFRLSVAMRRMKDDPGSGEKTVPSAELVSASVSRRIGGDWRLLVEGENLLDEEYFRSADRKAPWAAGRSFGLGLSWQPTATP